MAFAADSPRLMKASAGFLVSIGGACLTAGLTPLSATGPGLTTGLGPGLAARATGVGLDGGGGATRAGVLGLNCAPLGNRTGMMNPKNLVEMCHIALLFT